MLCTYSSVQLKIYTSYPTKVFFNWNSKGHPEHRTIFPGKKVTSYQLTVKPAHQATRNGAPKPEHQSLTMNTQYKLPGNICGSTFITLWSRYLNQNWCIHLNWNPESCAEKKMQWGYTGRRKKKSRQFSVF